VFPKNYAWIFLLRLLLFGDFHSVESQQVAGINYLDYLLSQKP